MKRTRVAIIVCSIGGGASVGQGAYIYAKAQLAQILLHRAWARTLAGEERAQPWPWADTWPIARLRMPEKDIELIVLAGDSGRVLAFGPGYHFGSALPGEPGYTVISAHRDTHFHFLRSLQPDDDIEMQTRSGQWYGYRVTTAAIVDAHEAVLDSNTNQSELLLVTCYPFDALTPGGPLRYVVTATPRSHASL